MSRILKAGAAVAALVLACVVLAAPGVASAHEQRDVAAGKYHFVVGFLNEPALLGEPNGIDLRITNKQTNQPVEGLEKTLKADIIVGGQTKTVDLRARFGMAGAYTADIIPTKTGTWAFRFYGSIEGTQVDERFESGPGRFNDVGATSDLQFPVQWPSVGDLAARVGATPAAAGASATTSGASAKDVQDAVDRANSARTLALILGGAGVLVGLAGLGVAGMALSRGRGGSSGRAGREPV